MRPALRASIKGFAGGEASKPSRREGWLVQLELERGERASQPDVGEEEGGKEWRGGLARCSAGEETQT